MGVPPCRSVDDGRPHDATRTGRVRGPTASGPRAGRVEVPVCDGLRAGRSDSSAACGAGAGCSGSSAACGAGAGCPGTSAADGPFSGCCRCSGRSGCCRCSRRSGAAAARLPDRQVGATAASGPCAGRVSAWIARRVRARRASGATARRTRIVCSGRACACAHARRATDFVVRSAGLRRPVERVARSAVVRGHRGRAGVPGGGGPRAYDGRGGPVRRTGAARFGADAASLKVWSSSGTSRSSGRGGRRG